MREADRALRIFTAWVLRLECGRAADFDATCARYPQFAHEFRRLRAAYDSIEKSLSNQHAESKTSQVGAPSSARYRDDGQLGTGGMGVVHSVFDRELRRSLAMKLLRSPDADRLARFTREARVTAQLDHPGIVPVHELGVDDRGHVFFTMKLVRGNTLTQVFDAVKRGVDGWNSTRALSVMLRVCEALAFAHEKGIIHRDLKPSNIMVGRYGETYVMDWGLARALGEKDTNEVRPRQDETTSTESSRRRESEDTSRDSTPLTMDGDQIGTPAYMPPEQARGDLERIGPHSDVYAVGAILYHLLSGRVPYDAPDAHSSPRAILALVQAGPPKPLHTLAKDVPAELLAICDKAMERDLKKRYPAMTEFADDLRAYLERRVVKAYETGAIAEMKKWVLRNKGLAAAAGVLLAVLVGSTIVVANKNREVEQANIEITQQKSAVEAKSAEVSARKAEFDQLAGVVLLETALKKEADLYPAWPDKIDAMEQWLANDAARLLAMKPTLARTIADLESRALPQTDAEREADRTSHPKLEELSTKRAQREALAAASPTDDSAKSLAELDTTIAALESEIAKRRTWTFAEDSQRFLHTTLDALRSELSAFEADTVASVRRRLDWAERIESLTLRHPNARATWDEARTALAKADDVVASTLYREVPIDLSPQLGLVPLGMNPRTKLWEFYDLRSACEMRADQDPAGIEIPTHRADGSIALKDDTGIVFVLIPGGTFVQGSQMSDRFAPNFDPKSEHNELPQAVTLAPFLIARHELTRGQWSRLFDGDEPGWYRRGASHGRDPIPIGWTHPIENVSWEECAIRLPRAGLALPTEAQWERAARGLADTPWWSGVAASSLAGVANLYDMRAEQSNPDVGRQAGDFDDGFVELAPVGSYAANPFGLFDVHGNVWEWCADWQSGRYSTPRDSDGLRDPTNGDRKYRVARGGSFERAASFSRCAYRYGGGIPTQRDYDLGVRPARILK